MNRLLLQLARFSAADRQLLASSSERCRTKYGCLGGIILICSFLFSLSIFFFFEISLRNEKWAEYLVISVAFVFALLAFFLLMNLYRVSVSLIGEGDGTLHVSISEIRQGLPVLIMFAGFGTVFGTCFSTLVCYDQLNKDVIEHKVSAIQAAYDKIDAEYKSSFVTIYMKLGESDQRLQQLTDKVNERKLAAAEAIEQQRGFSLLVNALAEHHMQVFSWMIAIGVVLLLLPLLTKRLMWANGPYSYLVDYQNHMTLAKYRIANDIVDFVHDGKTYKKDCYLVAEAICEFEAEALNAKLSSEHCQVI